MSGRAGRRLHFDRAGSGRPGVVLVHGWCCDRTTMSALADRLSGGRLVVNVDLPGCGLSEPFPEPYGSLDVVAGLVAAAADAGLERPVLVGHSMGAKFVLAAAQREPEWPLAAVLLDPLIGEDAAYVAARRAELDRPDWASLLRRRVDGMFEAAGDAGERARITELMLRASPVAARAALDASDQVDTAGALRACRCPVLYVGGSRPHEDAGRLRELNPRLHYARVPGAGHFVQVAAPDQVCALIERFVSAVTG